MMLSQKEILREIEKGNIQLTPFEPKNVGACSVDLRLGYEFRKFNKNKGTAVRVTNEIDSSEFSTLVKLRKNEVYILKPNELVLGITLEKLKLSNKICAKLDGRSRFARLGLTVHISSSLIQPGVDNVQVLEISNLSPFNLAISPGLKVCQITFHELTSNAEYSGQFKRQVSP